MPPEALKLLVDIQQSLALISEFTVGMNYEKYRFDEKSRAAVERKFGSSGNFVVDPDFLGRGL